MAESGRRLKLDYETSPETTTDVKDEDMVATYVREQVFSIPLVTDIIFDYLPLVDIYICSQISKTWFAMTTNYNRRRRPLLLKCPNSIFDLRKCRRFLRTNADFVSRRHIQGAYFTINSEFLQDYLTSGEVSDEQSNYDKRTHLDLLQLILAEIEMKHLVIKFDSSYEMLLRNGASFPLFLFDAIHTLTVKGDQSNYWIHGFSYDFSNLKSISTDTAMGSFRSFSLNLTKFDFDLLLRKCPALQQLKLPVDLQLLPPFVTREKLWLVNSLLIVCFDPPCKAMARNLANLGTPLETLVIDMFYYVNKKKWMVDLREVVQLLQPCFTSATKVIIRYEECDQILQIDMPALPWARKVDLAFTRHTKLEEYERGAVQDRLSQIFPNGSIVFVDHPVHVY